MQFFLCKAFIGVFIGLMLSVGGGAEPLVEGRSPPRRCGYSI